MVNVILEGWYYWITAIFFLKSFLIILLAFLLVFLRIALPAVIASGRAEDLHVFTAK